MSLLSDFFFFFCFAFSCLFCQIAFFSSSVSLSLSRSSSSSFFFFFSAIALSMLSRRETSSSGSNLSEKNSFHLSPRLPSWFLLTRCLSEKVRQKRLGSARYLRILSTDLKFGTPSSLTRSVPPTAIIPMAMYSLPGIVERITSPTRASVMIPTTTSPIVTPRNNSIFTLVFPGISLIYLLSFLL